jgi:glucosyl-dolichyl phosphate glucuronosyltransferase
MQPLMRWSIIVCTHNRCDDLARNLPRYNCLDYPDEQFEVLVVDNASKDATSDTVAAAGVRLVREERLGLSHARNRGIAEARGELIAFIDDDAWPEPGWLKELEQGFHDAEVACAGGKVVPQWEAGRQGWPDWIHPLLYAQFSVTGYGDLPQRTGYPRIPSGTNIAFRKAVLDRVGGFDPRLGRSGSCLISGEEGEMCLRVEQAGHKIVYIPGAAVHHLVPEQRLTRKWLLERSHWQGISSAIVERSALGRLVLLARRARFLALLTSATLLAPAVKLLGNERLQFLCDCQKILWRSYLEEIKGTERIVEQ